MSAAPFALFIASALLILVVFAGVARGKGEGRTVDYAAVNRLRLVFFVSLALILLAFFALTVPHLPYPDEASTPDRVVQAVGQAVRLVADRRPWAHTGRMGQGILARSDGGGQLRRSSSGSRRSTSTTVSASTHPTDAWWRRRRRCRAT